MNIAQEANKNIDQNVNENGHKDVNDEKNSPKKNVEILKILNYINRNEIRVTSK